MRLRTQVAIDPLPTVSGRKGVVIVKPHGQVELFDSYAGKNCRGNYRGNCDSRIGNIPIKIGIFRVNSMVSWIQVPEMENRYLRVILLEDGETVHNAFFDRGFVP